MQGIRNEGNSLIVAGLKTSTKTGRGVQGFIYVMNTLSKMKNVRSDKKFYNYSTSRVFSALVFFMTCRADASQLSSLLESSSIVRTISVE